MKKILKKLFFFIFRVSSKLGVFILPSHYYVPVSNIHQLEKTRETWAKKSALPGIVSDLDDQAQFARNICLPFQKEYIGNKVYKEAVNQFSGPGFGYIEAQALHAFIRYYRPQRIIEVGSGVSTYCILHALKMNKTDNNLPFQIHCIEPYPSLKLKKTEEIQLTETPVQAVPIEKFSSLSSGDFLFIDSSHTVKPGGDVNFLILEVLPRLSKGVLIHFHDIFLPYDYPRDVLKTPFQWMETSMLRAFLIHNHRARILFCLSQLHYGRPDVLKELFPEYLPARDENGLELKNVLKSGDRHFPASIFIEIL